MIPKSGSFVLKNKSIFDRKQPCTASLSPSPTQNVCARGSPRGILLFPVTLRFLLRCVIVCSVRVVVLLTRSILGTTDFVATVNVCLSTP